MGFSNEKLHFFIMLKKQSDRFALFLFAAFLFRLVSDYLSGKQPDWVALLVTASCVVYWVLRAPNQNLVNFNLKDPNPGFLISLVIKAGKALPLKKKSK
jgi:hypothetical protein